MRIIGLDGSAGRMRITRGMPGVMEGGNCTCDMLSLDVNETAISSGIRVSVGDGAGVRVGVKVAVGVGDGDGTTVAV